MELRAKGPSRYDYSANQSHGTRTQRMHFRGKTTLFRVMRREVGMVDDSRSLPHVLLFDVSLHVGRPVLVAPHVSTRPPLSSDQLTMGNLVVPSCKASTSVCLAQSVGNQYAEPPPYAATASLWDSLNPRVLTRRAQAQATLPTILSPSSESLALPLRCTLLNTKSSLCMSKPYTVSVAPQRGARRPPCLSDAAHQMC